MSAEPVRLKVRFNAFHSLSIEAMSASVIRTAADKAANGSSSLRISYISFMSSIEISETNAPLLEIIFIYPSCSNTRMASLIGVRLTPIFFTSDISGSCSPILTRPDSISSFIQSYAFIQLVVSVLRAVTFKASLLYLYTKNYIVFYAFVHLFIKNHMFYFSLTIEISVLLCPYRSSNMRCHAENMLK